MSDAITEALKSTVAKNDKLDKYRTTVPVMVSHSRTHLSVYVEGDLALEFNMNYQLGKWYEEENGDITVNLTNTGKKRGVRMGSPVTRLNGTVYRRLQFGTIPSLNRFGKSAATAWIDKRGNVEIELHEIAKPQKDRYRTPGLDRASPTPNPEPVPLANLPAEPTVEKSPPPGSEPLTTPAAFLRARLDGRNVPVSVVELRYAVGVLNGYLRENPSTIVELTEPTELQPNNLIKVILTEEIQ